jgi:hypothetical protein
MRTIAMKKSPILAFVVAVTIALCITMIPIPNVVSQPENIQVLSYSWYLNPSRSDYLVVVGEVQNVGPNIIDYVKVVGTFYASDGTLLGDNSVRSLATQILPQQKAPFYMLVPLSNSLTGSGWDPQSIENLTISVIMADPTDSHQYEDLVISSQTASTDASGIYMITGFVRNTGTQSASQVTVIATYYDSTGTVIGLGYNDLTSNTIASGSTASFTIYPLDYPAFMDQIASYSLLIQAPNTTPATTPTPSPSASSSPSPTPTASSSSPTPTETGNGTGMPNTYVYIAAAVVIIVIALGLFVVLVRRKRVGSRAKS